MKVLKYQIAQKVNYGTDDEPNIGLMLAEKSIDWNEVNEESAKREAYNGEPTVEDDGQPEPAPTETELLQAQIDALTIALLEV